MWQTRVKIREALARDSISAADTADSPAETRTASPAPHRQPLSTYELVAHLLFRSGAVQQAPRSGTGVWQTDSCGAPPG